MMMMMMESGRSTQVGVSLAATPLVVVNVGSSQGEFLVGLVSLVCRPLRFGT